MKQIAGEDGDGYKGKSPHTDSEKFEGVTLARAALVSKHNLKIHVLLVFISKYVI